MNWRIAAMILVALVLGTKVAAAQNPPVSAGCKSNMDCKQGYACSEGQCKVSLGGACTNSQECAGALECIEGVCFQVEDTPNCQAGRDCEDKCETRAYTYQFCCSKEEGRPGFWGIDRDGNRIQCDGLRERWTKWREKNRETLKGDTGLQGPPGENGKNPTVEPEPPGPNCQYGGSKFTAPDGAVAFACNGKPGLSCWDTDEDGVKDLEEDTNKDGKWNTKDCSPLCWDLNENGVRDPSEDTNGDGEVTDSDCRPFRMAFTVGVGYDFTTLDGGNHYVAMEAGLALEWYKLKLAGTGTLHLGVANSEERFFAQGEFGFLVGWRITRGLYLSPGFFWESSAEDIGGWMEDQAVGPLLDIEVRPAVLAGDFSNGAEAWGIFLQARYGPHAVPKEWSGNARWELGLTLGVRYNGIFWSPWD